MTRSAASVLLLAGLLVGVVLAAGIVGKAMLDRARLSEAVYEVGKAPDGWQFLEGGEKDSGFKWGVYERTLDDGTKERVLAIAGTDVGFGSVGQVQDTLRDGWTDATQALKGPDGLPPTQYTEALMETLRQIQYANRDGVPLTLTGHSLGGGLSQYASLMTGVPATVFNSAPLGPSTRAQLPRDADVSKITNVRIDGDPVSEWAQHVRGGTQYGQEVVIHPAPGAPGILPDDERSLNGYVRSRYGDDLADFNKLRNETPSALDFGNWLKNQRDKIDKAGDIINPRRAAEVLAQYAKDKATDLYNRHVMTTVIPALENQLGVTPQPPAIAGPTASATNPNTPPSHNTGQPQQADTPGGDKPATGSRYNGPSIEELIEKDLLVPTP
ncbi:MAG: hypothetical protein GC164_10040 [Phycisphaera sp.]|nr:hypothetical protein [Phycisphaera sp.]